MPNRVCCPLHCLLLALFVGALAASAATWPAPPVRPPADHPRVLLREADLAAVRTARQDAALAPFWLELRRRAALPADFKARGDDDPTLLRGVEANAFLALVENDAALARRVYPLTVELLSGGGEKRFTTYFGRMSLGRSLLAAACVYDWCHAFFDAEQLATLRRLMLENASHMEIGYPPDKGGSITTHGSGTPLLRDQLAMAIAFGDEAPEVYDTVAGRIYAEYVAPRQFTYGGHFNHQGSEYGLGRFSCDAWAATLIVRMGAPAPWSLENMAQVPYYFLYLRRPDGGMIKDGDDFLGKTRPAGSYWIGSPQPWLLFAGLFHDAHFAAEWRRHLANVPGRSSATEDPTDPILAILFRPDLLRDPGLQTLPLSRYFPEPNGAIIARTGWQIGPDSLDAVAYLKIGTHRFDNHQHADSGQFQLFHRGSLAIDSGIYESPDTGYGRPHHRNYTRRSVAHNTLLIEDPDETFTFDGEPTANDGGQRTIEGAFTMEDFWRQNARTGRVLAHYIGPDSRTPEVSLIKGDLTAAYSPEKSRRVTRTMAFFQLPDTAAPAALIVLDDVTSARADQRQVSLLHSIEEPRIDGNVVTIARTGPQMELLRWPAASVASDENGATIIFAAPDFRVGRARRVELSCPLRWEAERFHLTLDGQPIELPANSGFTAEVTDRAAAALAAHHPLSLRVAGAGAADALRALSGPEAPQLRIWNEVAPFHGKLVQTTLLPAAGAAKIVKIGGPGHEFESGGKNWPATPLYPAPMGGDEAGAWRVETSLTKPDQRARFLQVYQVGDLGASFPRARLLEGPGVLGVSVAGRLLLAASDGDRLSDGAAFDVAETDVEPSSGTALVTLTDLPAGDHSLWLGDRIAGAAAIEAPAHTWVVRLRPGHYLLHSKISAFKREFDSNR
ncbi:MAG TPA: heparinase II/III family protein [Opitutaceae bacterium]|nr:heparinase II/III family protein [Opitutaceae bacterium]